MTPAEIDKLIFKYTGIRENFPEQQDELRKLVRAVIDCVSGIDTHTIDMFEANQ